MNFLPLKTSEKLWFPDVFRECRKRPVAWKRVWDILNFKLTSAEILGKISWEIHFYLQQALKSTWANFLAFVKYLCAAFMNSIFLWFSPYFFWSKQKSFKVTFTNNFKLHFWLVPIEFIPQTKKKYFFVDCHNSSAWNIEIRIKTSHMICTGFYMKCNAGLKWVKVFFDFPIPFKLS